MRVGIVGINHKLADLKLREKLAKACQKWFGVVQSVHEQHFFILLSTCNRTEIYFCSQDLTAAHIYLLSILREEVEEEFDHKLYSYFGVDCLTHLTRVTLGLDSAIIGETEIQGQVKLAYETTVNCHSLPSDLHFLFQKALGISKKLRSELQFGRGMPNLEQAVLQIGRHVFPRPEKMKLLFVGASEINEKILLFFKNKQFQNLTLCNRSDNPARHFAEKLGVHYLDWSNFSSWQEYDWIVFGTKSPNYLLTAHSLKDKNLLGQKLILDLCVPRNVDPKLGNNANVVLLNIDQINCFLKIRSRHMTDLLTEAEKRVFEATHRSANRYSKREFLSAS